MSATNSITAPTPTGRCGNLYDTPVRDAVCAMPYSKRHIDYMSSCCQKANIISYYDDCGLYCLARDQTAQELTQCLYDAGAKWENVFCRGEGEATATGEGKPLASSDARLVDKGEQDDAKDDKDEKDDKDDNDDDESNDTDSTSHGATSHTKAGVSVIGVIIGTLLFSATAFGTLQT